MTDFIRNILANATANTNDATVKVEVVKPMNQIQIPAAVSSTLGASPAGAVEKQRLIKVEIPETAATTTASKTALVPPADAGKAQRAARRDVVNARRDKRKAMAQASTSSVPSSPMALTSNCGSSSDSEDEMEDKSKKMKTSLTSSVPVAGGLAASESVKKPSLSSTLPPTPGLLFTPEIDAAGEERLRAMEAQLETLDPDSKEAKKKRRLIRNRMSAQLHRERKKAYVGQLEDQLLEKDRELKLLQEKLAKMMEESDKLKQQVSSVEKMQTQEKSAKTEPKPTQTPKKKEDEVMIKDEPQNWDTPWAVDASETWDLPGLEDAEIAEIETSDLLRDFDDPFAGLGGAEYPDFSKPHHEIHAAKKNLAMMAAVMFSVSFFGNSPAILNVAPGSNFSSTFGATSKEFSQMSIASRIVACLEKTTWKEFRDVSSWISACQSHAKEENAESVKPVASPSAASDVTDSIGSSCGSPANMIDDCLDEQAIMNEADLIGEFEYPVEDPFGTAGGADWFVGDDDKDTTGKEDFFPSELTLNEPTPKKSSSITSRLYDALTTLWREKNQVLLTVRNDKQQVLHRSVADMSSIREGFQTGSLFTRVLGNDAAGSAAEEDQSVTFLYPMSAFSSDAKPSNPSSDAMFLEVSCLVNGAAVAQM